MSRSTINAGLFGALGKARNLTASAAIVAAAGSNSQANSTLLTDWINIVTTVSTTTKGVKFPVAVTGMIIIVVNAVTTNMKLYPNTSAKLGIGASADANVSLAALKTKGWVAQSRTQWVPLFTLA